MDMSGMDMPGMHGSAASTSSAMAMMVPYLHFTGGDYLYFVGVAPTSRSAIAGACIILAVLAIVERAIGGVRGIIALKLAERDKKLESELDSSASSGPRGLAEKTGSRSTGGSAPASSPNSAFPLPAHRHRRMAPLLWKRELARSALFIVQSFFHYSLMLGVMTFNAGYIISIIAGSAIGEVLFGRFAAEAGH